MSFYPQLPKCISCFEEHFPLITMPQNPASRILFVLCLTIFPPVAAISSSSRQEKQITNYGRDRAVHPLDRNPASKENISFFPVAYLSAMNSIVNVIRPDASIIWQVWAFKCKAFLFFFSLSCEDVFSELSVMFFHFILLRRHAYLVFYGRYALRLLRRLQTLPTPQCAYFCV